MYVMIKKKKAWKKKKRKKENKTSHKIQLPLQLSHHVTNTKRREQRLQTHCELSGLKKKKKKQRRKRNRHTLVVVWRRKQDRDRKQKRRDRSEHAGTACTAEPKTGVPGACCSTARRNWMAKRSTTAFSYGTAVGIERGRNVVSGL